MIFNITKIVNMKICSICYKLLVIPDVIWQIKFAIDDKVITK